MDRKIDFMNAKWIILTTFGIFVSLLISISRIESSGLLIITTYLNGSLEGHLITFPDLTTMSIDCANGDITTLSHYHNDHCATCNNPGNFQYNRHNVGPGQIIYNKDGVIVTVVAVNGSIIGEGVVDKPCNADWENEWSMALLIKYKGFDYLTAGDMYGSVESPLGAALKARGVKVDVFKASHHGSGTNNTSSLEFFQDILPEYATICGTRTEPCAGGGITIPNLITAGTKKIYCIPEYDLSCVDSQYYSRVRNGTGTLTISTDGSAYSFSAADFTDGPFLVDEYVTSNNPHLIITEIAIDNLFLLPENHRWIELYLPPGAPSMNLNNLYWINSDKKEQIAKNGLLTMYPGDVTIIHKMSSSTDTAYIDENNKTGKGSNGLWDIYTKLNDDYWYPNDDCLIISREDSIKPNPINICDAIVWSNWDGYIINDVITKGNFLIECLHWGKLTSGDGQFISLNESAAIGDIRTGYIQRTSIIDIDSKMDWKISSIHSYGTPPPVPIATVLPLPPPSFDINVNSNNLFIGEKFSTSITIQSLVDRTFDGYVIIITPAGKMYSIQYNNKLISGVVPIVKNIKSLPHGYTKTLLNIRTSVGMEGNYKIIGGLTDAGVKVKGIKDSFWNDIEYISIK